MVRIEIDSGEAEKCLAAFNLQRMKARLRTGVRATLKAGKQEAAQRIRARYVKPQIGISALKVRVSGLQGTLRSSGPRNSLMKFIVKPKTRPPHNPRGGIYAQVLRGGGGYLPHAFIGRGQVFEREGKRRLPIKRLTSVSAPGMVGNPHVQPSVISKIEQRLQEELAKAVSV